MEDINRIKTTLFEKKITTIWLSSKIGTTLLPSANSIPTLLGLTSTLSTEIAEVLDIDVRTLICTNK